VLEGESDKEVLLSTYLCHPSMANNELSGPLAMAFLYRKLAALPRRKFNYRFVFAPETIGVIAYLSLFGEQMKKATVAGYVATCCADTGPFTYKRSKHKNSLADRAAEHVLKFLHPDHSAIDFAVGGSDERQYCSPGFNMPVGSLMRTMYQRYPEYHTSLDNKGFISFEALEESVEVYFSILTLVERNEKLYSVVQHCEPQLGKRGLYPDSIKPGDAREALHNMLHLLSFSDGDHDLIEIADERPAFAEKFYEHVDKCLEAGVLKSSKHAD
ncbi:MAG: DUF4910 domain-containing protein, partial [Flavobacteriales bacterium]|nr:DUF4910 domain-containing protein [Flavobacteriales bacterium]